MKHVQVLFLSLFTYADAAVDMLSGRNTYVTLDRVMGGQSSATGTATADGSSIVFEGSVSTQGGGFAYMTFSGGSSMDLTANSGSGILLTFETMKQSTYGSAPLGFNIELEESGRRCTLSAAFAVPMTSEVERVQAWVPFTQFEPKGSHWQYSQSSTGVPSTCGSSTASTAGVTRFAIGNYYQEGPFRLVLYSVETRTAPPASLLAPSPSVSPNDLLTGAAYRARTLMAKVGAGVGEAQMAGMAAAVLATAAAQAGDAALVAIVDGIASSTAAVRAATLAEAFKVSQSGGTPSLDALMSVGTASASTTSVDGTSSASATTFAAFVAAGRDVCSGVRHSCTAAAAARRLHARLPIRSATDGAIGYAPRRPAGSRGVSRCVEESFEANRWSSRRSAVRCRAR